MVDPFHANKKPRLSQDDDVKKSFLSQNEYQEIFNKMKDILCDYNACCWKDVEAEAFSILIVLCGKRTAMLVQTSYNPRDAEYPEHQQFAKKQQLRALQLGKQLKCLINDEFALSGIVVSKEDNGAGFLIYSIAIQDAVDARMAAGESSCIHLRYLYPYKPEMFTCFAGFDLNKNEVYSFGCFEITPFDLYELKIRLEAYKEVALGLRSCEITLHLKIPLNIYASK